MRLRRICAVRPPRYVRHLFEDVDLNWWAILVATFVPIVVGMVWYRALAEPWMRAVGKTREELGGANTGYAVALLCAFVMAYVLARVIAWAEADDPGAGLVAGILVWIGFVATTMAVNTIFAGRTLRLWLIDGAYHLVCLMGMGLILGAWD
jgi:hypothetical protein